MNTANLDKKAAGRLYSLTAKTAAVILFAITATVTALFGIAFLYMCYDGGFYGSENADNAFYGSQLCQRKLSDSAREVLGTIQAYAKHEYPSEESYFSALDTALDRIAQPASSVAVQVEIAEFGGSPLYTFGGAPESYGMSVRDEMVFELELDGKPDILFHVTSHVYLRKPLSDTPDYFLRLRDCFSFLFSIRYLAPLVAALGAIASTALFVYLMKAAGRRYGEEGIREGFFDRIPYDFLVLCFLAAAALFIAIVDDFVPSFGRATVTGYIVLAATYFAVSVIPLLLMLLALAYTTAVRIKTRTLLQNTLVWRLWALACKILRKIWGWLKSLYEMLPATGKTALLVLAFLFFNPLLISALIEANSYGGVIDVFLVFLMLAALNIGAFFVLIRAAYELVVLRQGSSGLAEGDLDYKFPTEKLHGEAKKIAQNLNRISDGMAKAVEMRSKSERMKVELITNVSHDLKTPLTSIINYVDLLKKEPMQTEAATQYIEVLDRQASRLRKLTSDLIEASKASTGNIEVKLEPTDICELIDQSAAEYADRFSAANLTPIIRTPDRPVVAYADGKLLWRVLDNLLSNVCKYSLPQTRVYIDITSGDSMAAVTIRNISAQQLGGIDPDELTERFVRGDSSRSGEGSGLGLSIARSLTELQGGRLKIYLDGDMFKVTITMPLAMR